MKDSNDSGRKPAASTPAACKKSSTVADALTDLQKANVERNIVMKERNELTKVMVDMALQKHQMEREKHHIAHTSWSCPESLISICHRWRQLVVLSKK